MHEAVVRPGQGEDEPNPLAQRVRGFGVLGQPHRRLGHPPEVGRHQRSASAGREPVLSVQLRRVNVDPCPRPALRAPKLEQNPLEQRSEGVVVAPSERRLRGERRRGKSGHPERAAVGPIEGGDLGPKPVVPPPQTQLQLGREPRMGCELQTRVLQRALHRPTRSRGQRVEARRGQGGAGFFDQGGRVFGSKEPPKPPRSPPKLGRVRRVRDIGVGGIDRSLQLRPKPGAVAFDEQANQRRRLVVLPEGPRLIDEQRPNLRSLFRFAGTHLQETRRVRRPAQALNGQNGVVGSEQPIESLGLAC